MSRDRRKRLLRILELISIHPIETQDDLVRALETDGWRVTQSSVSRDIAELGLIKAGGIYRQPSRLSADRHDPDTERIREGVLMTEAAGANLIVIHTPPGEANRVAVAIDRLQWEEAVGTIAGDDTIFVAVHSAPAGKALIDRIQALTR